MAADRNPPTEVTQPAGIAGDAYAARIAEEIIALYKGTINQVGSVGGSANAITGTCTPALTGTSPDQGETFRLTPTSTNTAAVTVNLNSTGVIPLVDEDGSPLVAGDVVSGRPIFFWYHESDNEYRLHTPTLRSIIASLSTEIENSGVWELLGDTTVTSAVSTIEHQWDADGYSEIKVKLLGVSGSTGGGTALTVDLRTSGASLIPLGLGAQGGTIFGTYDVNFTLDTNSATREYYVIAHGARGNAVIVPVEDNAQTASIPDRIRISFATGNVDAGRFLTYGLRLP